MPTVTILSRFIAQAIACSNQLFERWQEKQFGWSITPQIDPPTMSRTISNHIQGQGNPMQIDVTEFKPLTQ